MTSVTNGKYTLERLSERTFKIVEGVCMCCVLCAAFFLKPRRVVGGD